MTSYLLYSIILDDYVEKSDNMEYGKEILMNKHLDTNLKNNTIYFFIKRSNRYNRFDNRINCVFAYFFNSCSDD